MRVTQSHVFDPCDLAGGVSVSRVEGAQHSSTHLIGFLFNMRRNFEARGSVSDCVASWIS